MLTADIVNLLKSIPGSNLVVTVGNSFRGDDGVGPYISDTLKKTTKLNIIEAGINPENIIDAVIALKPDRIFIFDAADFNGLAGEVRLIPKESIPEGAISTHAIPLNVITELIAASIKTEIYFIGIQPKSVSMREDLSVEVKKAADDMLDIIKSCFS